VNESLNSTIHLSEGTFTGTGNVLVEINKAHQSQGGTLTIIGAGYNNTFIDAGSSANMFDIKADSIVKLVNITFINGKNTNGGTIINAGDLSISNCIFENNYATSKGGAIYSTGGNLTISDSKFKNNSAASYSGAIYATSTLFNISDSSFIGNYAKYAERISRWLFGL
jgi:predicted outer membrane repeat protein